MLRPEATDDFEVSWDDPAHAEQSWRWDEMHSPRPMVPVAQDLNAALTVQTFGSELAIVNGYPFAGQMTRLPAPERSERDGRTAAQIWYELYEPRTRELLEGLRQRDYAAMSTQTLAGSLDGLLEQYGLAQRYTMVPVFMLVGEANQFIEFCEQHFGDEGETLAATMLQGVANESAEAGEGLAALAATAAQSAELAAAIRDGRYDAIERCAGGQQFIAAFRDYLDAYGWRAESWGDLDRPTWAEDPAVPLGLIARYLASPETSPRVGYERAARRRAEAIRDARERLEGNVLRARFDELLAITESYVPVREGRAFFQLALAGVMRIPLLELGRRFVASGDLGEPDDALFLYVEELQALAAGTLDEAKALVAGRRAEFAHQQTLKPPPYVGVEPPPMPPGMRMFSPDPPAEPLPERTLQGVGASPGVVTGRARVIATLEEAGRLEQGDVLVCRSTAAPWTPLFAVAGAVVTNTGGILSHSAIVAREYAIPCVVGTRDATEKIEDGAMVTVDGGSGIVTIER